MEICFAFTGSTVVLFPVDNRPICSTPTLHVLHAQHGHFPLAQVREPKYRQSTVSMSLIDNLVCSCYSSFITVQLIKLQ